MIEIFPLTCSLICDHKPNWRKKLIFFTEYNLNYVFYFLNICFKNFLCIYLSDGFNFFI